MAATLLKSLRDRGLPTEPPAENPHETARESWDKLRQYATGVAAITMEIDDENKTLRAELDSMQRENERLAEETSTLRRENRLVSAYAQTLRTRLTAIREALEVAERESLQYATNTVREKEQTEVQTQADQHANGSAAGLPENAWTQ